MDLWAQTQQSLHALTIPSNPQTVTFGYRFNLNLQGVSLTLLRALTFVDRSDPSLDGVALQISPQAWLTRACTVSRCCATCRS